MADFGDEIGLQELAARDVDADEQRLVGTRQCRLPADHFLDRARQHIAAELDDEIGLLRDGNELGGAELAVARMVPANQRLEADEALGRERDDRLVEDGEATLIDGAAQIALDGDALILLAAHLGGEDFYAVGTGALGAIHSGFRLAQ